MSVLPESNAEYGTKSYWNARYAAEAPDATFDWFKTFADLQDWFSLHIPSRSSRICMLGCGNSTLSADLYDAGYRNIVNVDYSDIVVQKMKLLHGVVRPEMTWITGDIRSLPFGDGSFDVVIDKGTMDALMCDKGDVWDPPESVVTACRQEVDEAARIIASKGVFLYVTFGQPHFRKRHLERSGVWDVNTTEMGGHSTFHYYAYAMRKFS